MLKRLAFTVLLIGACGGDGGSQNHDPSILGLWTSEASGVGLRATFTGAETAGSAKLSQLVTSGSDCITGLHTDGAFTVTGTSITISVTSAHQTTTAGCGAATDIPITDLTALQNFAAALSGPFELTSTTLKLGSAYPTFDKTQ